MAHFPFSKNLKSELEHMMTKKGFQPGEGGSLPGAHFLMEAARGHTHLTLLASGAAGDAGGRPLHGLNAQQQ